MEKKRIIFDLDGVLIGTTDFNKSVSRALDKFNIKYTSEDVRNYVNGMKSYEEFYRTYTMEYYLEHLKKCSGLDITFEYLEYYLNAVWDLVPESISDDIKDVLEYLKEKYSLVVLTNYFSETQYKRLEYFDIAKYFEIVFGGIYVKPDKEAFYEACGEYDLSECVMIGDNYKIDIMGAINAGMDAIYYNSNGTVNNEKEIKDILYLKKIL